MIPPDLRHGLFSRGVADVATVLLAALLVFALVTAIARADDGRERCAEVSP